MEKILSGTGIFIFNKFFLIGFLFIISSSVRADDPLGGGVGVRPLALGRAYAGFANDISSIFTNPAGLVEIGDKSFSSMYTQPVRGTTFTSLCGAFPAFWDASIGVGYRNRTLSDMLVSQETAGYTDQDLTLCFAKKIRDNLSFGANYRFITRGFSKDISGFEGKYGSGSVFDFGLKYDLSSWFGAGLSFQGMGGKIINRDKSEEEIGGKGAAGFFLKAAGKDAYYRNFPQDIFIVTDISKPLDLSISLLHMGLEWWPINSFALRLGLDQSPKTAAENYNDISAGFGMIYNGVTFDYAYRKLDLPVQKIEHYFSLGYSPPAKKAMPAYPLAGKELLHFKDVPGNYWAREPIGYLTTLGVLDWYPDGSFKPEKPVSRAEVVMLLSRERKFPLPQEVKQVFADVPVNYWAASYIQTAKEKRLTYGYPDGTFKPRNPTSRVEGVVFAARFADLKPTLRQVLESPFLDISDTHWGIKEILSAADNKVIQYYLKKDELQPQQSLTRAELAEILFRTPYIKYKVKEQFGKEVD